MLNVPHVKDFMTRKVISLKPEMDIYEAIQILLRNKISGATVVDPENRLVGILSEKDCLRMFVEGAMERIPGGKVSGFMSSNLMTCSPEDDLFKVADIFFNNSFRRLPVVDGDKLIGLVSRRDVLLGSIDLWQDSPFGKKWTDSKYLTDQLKAVLSSRHVITKDDVRTDATE